MKTFHLFIAIVLACIAYLFIEKWRRWNVLSEIEASNGTFDIHAQNALDSIENLQSLNNKDRFLAARIIDLNGHDGRINNVRVLNNVVGHYMHNLRPYAADAVPEKDPLDWFELDQIENFMDRHIDIMRANPEHNNFIEAVLKARPKKVIKTLENVKEESNTKKEAFETYVDNTITFTNDPQNVHDSAVNEQLRKTWKRLQETTPPTLNKQNVFSQIQTHIETFAQNNPDNQLIRKRAKRALEEFNDAKYNSTIGALESDLINVVWARSELPANFKRKDMIKDAIVESLVDMSDDGNNVVCSNGRCARLLESLLFTDSDENAVKGAMTIEQIRNDAFKTSNDILQSTVKEISMGGASVDKDLVTVAQSYDNPEINTDPSSEKKFKEIVKGKIEAYLKTQYEGKMSKKDFSNVRDHCIAAIESI